VSQGSQRDPKSPSIKGQAEIQQWRKAYGLKGEEIPKAESTFGFENLSKSTEFCRGCKTDASNGYYCKS
jgi:hypothetical protein